MADRTAERSDRDEADRPHETEAERADRNFNELLQELRVAQTGVQILFAFLLTMPLQQRFQTLDDVQRGFYIAALLLSTSASISLIAPVAFHRMLFRERKKDWIVRSADRMAELGLTLLGLAVTASVTLIMDIVLSRPVALTVGAVIAVVIVALWFVVPLTLGRRAGSQAT